MRDKIIDEYRTGQSMEGYRVFGAHFTREYEQDGVRFTVYAPHAEKVELIGDFNGWTGWSMQRDSHGIWSMFAQDIKQGALYKYRIHTQQGEVCDRMDPFAFLSEKRPDTASVVWNLDGFGWTDWAYLDRRDKNFTKPMSIYEVHLGSWHKNGQEFLNYEQAADLLIPYLQELGCTHVEFLPLTEHPLDASWGYQTTGYFSATSRYGTPHQLMKLVDRCHAANIGVIMDFVPLHFVTDFYALHQFDGGYLYESENEAERFSQWGTVLFDFTKPHVLSFMKSALDFWLSYYHIDGIRYDAVSNLIYHGGQPERGVNEPGVWFLKNTNYALGQKWPGVMLIAEDSSMYLKVTAPVEYGGLGFDYKWDLGFMNDTFAYLQSGERRQNRISASTEYYYQEKYILPFSHDEVVHGKKTIVDKLPGTYEQKFAQARVLYLYMFTHPGKKLNFMGGELAELKEWDEEKELAWNLRTYPAHDAFFHYICELGNIYYEERALYGTDLHPDGFRWVMRGGGVFAYERRDLAGQVMLVVLNFTNETRHIAVPAKDGAWKLCLSTQETQFGGETPIYARQMGGQLQLEMPNYSGGIWRKK